MNNLSPIKSLNDFMDQAAGYERYEFDESTREIYEFIFIEEIGWDEIQSYLNLEMAKESIQNIPGWLLKHYCMILKFYKNLPKSKFDLWTKERFEDFDNWIKFQLELHLQILNKVSAVEKKPLFVDVKFQQPALDLLKSIGKLDLTGRFIKGKAGSKGAIVAWQKALEKCGLLNIHNDIQSANLLNDLIPNLFISDRVMRETGTKDYNKYYSQFLAEINKIKHRSS